nr:hypothetical protein CFP56_73214 [Quercus suber]
MSKHSPNLSSSLGYEWQFLCHIEVQLLSNQIQKLESLVFSSSVHSRTRTQLRALGPNCCFLKQHQLLLPHDG